MHGKLARYRRNLDLGANDEGVRRHCAMEANHNVRGKTMAGFGPFPAALMSLANNVTADSGMKALKGNPFKYTI